MKKPNYMIADIHVSCTHMCIHIHTHTHIHAWTILVLGPILHTYIYVYIYVYCLHIHTWIHMCTFLTYIHTHTYQWRIRSELNTLCVLCAYTHASGQKLNPMMILPRLGARQCIPDILTRMAGNTDHLTPQVLQLVAGFFFPEIILLGFKKRRPPCMVTRT